MKKFSLVLAVLLIAPMALVAQDAQSLKVGVINLNKVMITSEIGKASYTKIQEFRQNNENDLQQQADLLRGEISQLENQRTLLTADAYESKRNDLQKKQLDLEQKAQRYQRELQRINQEELQKFIKVAGPIIRAVGEEQGFTLLLDPSTQGSQVLYFDDAIDITDMVIERVNAAGAAADSGN